MNREELVNSVHKDTGFTKTDIERVLLSTLETITKELERGRDVRLQGFGVFRMKYRARRTGHNISTNGVVNIPAMFVPVFEPGKYLKEKTVREADL